MCGDGSVSVYTGLGGSFVARCASTHANTLKHTRLKEGKRACANTRSLRIQKENIFPCVCAIWPCRLTRAHYRGKQQWNRWQWKADMTLRLLEPTWKRSAVGHGGGGRERYCRNEQTELSTNSNVNCTGLHNLRLMRKQRQIKFPSFYPGWLCSTGALFIKKASEAVL